MKRNMLILLLSIAIGSSSCSKKEDTSSDPANTFNPQLKIDALTTGK
jgi:hypothetical protein